MVYDSSHAIQLTYANWRMAKREARAVWRYECCFDCINIYLNMLDSSSGRVNCVLEKLLDLGTEASKDMESAHLTGADKLSAEQLTKNRDGKRNYK